MTEQEWMSRLAQAVDHAAPDDIDAVLSRCGEQKGTVISMVDTMSKKKRNTWKGLVAACLAFVLLAGGIGGVSWRQTNAVASIVSLDVNPSIELKINRNEKVLSCAALNEDAAKVLFSMNGGKDLEGTKINVAVNAIVGALVKAGYLDSASSAILVSVEDKDSARAQRVEQEVVDTVTLALQDSPAQVLSQIIDEGPQLPGASKETEEKLAAELSKGKLVLVTQVSAMMGDTLSDSDYEKLCALSVEELSDMLEHGIMFIPIGREAAAQAAEKYAGKAVWGGNVVRNIESELDEFRPHYEVEFIINGKEYEYLVDAQTGEVYGGVPNISLSEPAPSQPSQPPVSEITAAQAKAAAFKHAGCDESSVIDCEIHKEYEHGAAECWDVEFCWNGMEYEYEISLTNGSVLEWSCEKCDDSSHPHGTAHGEHDDDD